MINKNVILNDRGKINKMVCIIKNSIGDVFINERTINKTIENDVCKNNQNNIFIKKIYSNIINDSDVYVEVETTIKKNKSEINIKYLNIIVSNLIKKSLDKNFKLFSKNISIIYDFI